MVSDIKQNFSWNSAFKIVKSASLHQKDIKRIALTEIKTLRRIGLVIFSKRKFTVVELIYIGLQRSLLSFSTKKHE
jgi:hypothetical protein